MVMSWKTFHQTFFQKKTHVEGTGLDLTASTWKATAQKTQTYFPLNPGWFNRDPYNGLL